MARTGADALKKAIKTAGSAGSFTGKLGYCNWKEGESKVLRFVTDVDDVLTVKFYEWIVDNQGKSQNFIVAPDLYDGGPDWVKEYGGKMREKGLTGDLVDPFPRERTVAIAVLQEEDPQEVNGKTVIRYRDAIEEIEYKGEKYPSRQFVIIKQALRNFWQPLVGFYDEYDTICDRPYKITRVGARTDTTYQVVPKTPEPGDFDYKEHLANYGYGEVRDENDPDRFLFCPQTLMEWAEYYCSEDRVKFFLGDPKDRPQKKETEEVASSNGTGPVTEESDEAQASPPPEGGDFSDLRARLRKHRP